MGFTLGMILLTIYMGAFEKYLRQTIPGSSCPEYWEEQDYENGLYKE